MDWPTATLAAGLGAAAIGGLIQVIKPKKPAEGETLADVVVKNLRDDSEDRRQLLRELVKTHQDNTLILKELAMVSRMAGTKTEELHKSTHAKLGEITENQKQILVAIVDGLDSLSKRAA